MRKDLNLSKKEANNLMRLFDLNGKAASEAIIKRILRKLKFSAEKELTTIILLALRTKIIKGKLIIPDKIADFIITAQGVYDGIFNNVSGFYTPVPAFLAILKTRNADLVAAEGKVTNKVAGAVALRNTCMVLVELTLDDAVSYINGLARVNQLKAISIIQESTMTVIEGGVITKPPFGLKRGPNTGTVKCTAKAIPTATAYQWQWSPDCIKINDLDSTSAANTMATGLPPLTKIYFRFRAITPKGLTDWCNWIYIIVL